MDASPTCGSGRDFANALAADRVRQETAGGDCCTVCAECRCARLLTEAGMRPTRQRLILSELLFANGNRHVTAETLYAEALAADVYMSRATVYNTLNHFLQAGLLRRIGPEGSRTSFFDTNTTAHPHYYLHAEGILLDIPETDLMLENMPQPLPGHEVSRVDVIIHLRRKRN
jgi:Fur family iron response transcriptional regulator